MKTRFIYFILASFRIAAMAADTDLSAVYNFIASRAGLEVYHGDTKCATRYQMDVMRYWNDMNQQNQQLWLTSMQLDTARTEQLITPAGHFKLHWNNTGVHAVPQADLSGNGVPDYIDSAAVIFDQVWHTEIELLGYNPPPGSDGNPAAIYQIYFTDQGYYGLTWFDQKIETANRVRYTSFMEVENDFAGFYSPGLKGLKVTAAHEFHHAIQLGYNVRQQDFFFYEMTSTWMEEYNYPEINDYRQYLDDFFDQVSNTPFNYYNQYTYFPYGNFLYVDMLDAIYGAGIVRQIWESMLTRTTLDALRYVLSSPAYGSSWLGSVAEYGKWLYYTGDRTQPGNYFTDAADFPLISISSGDRYIFPGGVPETVALSPLTNLYLEFIGTRGAQLDLLVTAPAFSDGGFRLMSSGGESGFYNLGEPYSSPGIGADTLTVQLANALDTGRNFGIDLNSGTPEAITIGPNPVRLDRGDREVLFRNIPADGEIFIFTTNGLEVAHIEDQASPTRIWNLTNKNGDTVSSGIYVYLVKSSEMDHSGKFAILR
jgi:hypothetical protein